LASTFGQQDILNARPYWLQKNLYTSVTTLGAGLQTVLFNVSGWNTSGVQLYAELSALGITQMPGLRIDITADGQTYQYWANEFPSALRLLPMGHGAVRNLQAVLTNTTTTTMYNVQVVQQMLVWVLPVTEKILLGYPLTAQDQALARRANVELNPAAETRVLPIPVSTVIERTYYARRILPWVGWARSVPNVGTTPTTFTSITVGPNQIAVLLEAAIESRLADQVTLTVARDTDTQAMQVRGDAIGREGKELFLPAKQYLTFSLSAAQTVAGSVPVRLKVLRASLSAILALRMGILDVAGLAGLIGGPKAQTIASNEAALIESGVR